MLSVPSNSMSQVTALNCSMQCHKFLLNNPQFTSL